MVIIIGAPLWVLTLVVDIDIALRARSAKKRQKALALLRNAEFSACIYPHGQDFGA